MMYLRNQKKYIVCKDLLFFDKIVIRLDADYIENPKDLSSKVKSNMDTIYNNKLVKIRFEKKRREALDNWDGYTSDQVKRDDKIKQII